MVSFFFAFALICFSFRVTYPLFPCFLFLDTVSPLYNDIRYNSKIRYDVNSVCTKISGSCIFSLTVPRYFLGKHMFFDICKNRLAEAILTNTQNV